MYKKGYKVKRRKSLYKIKKSGFRRIVEAFLFVVLAAGLGFVGFAVAKAVFNYTPKEPSEIHVDVPVTNDAEMVTETASDNAGNVHNIDTTDKDEQETAPKRSAIGKANYAPSNVLASSAALSAYLESVKADGCNSIIIELKDEEGRILYKSEVEEAKSAEDIVFGELTAEQIVKACTSAGINPFARISTLKDPLAPRRIADVSYRFADGNTVWLDGRPDAGGKAWADPARLGTVEYLGKITQELLEAGFSDVVYANMIFPHFISLDVPPNPDDRFTALKELLNSANKAANSKSDKNVLIEVALRDFPIHPTDTPSKSAEILRNSPATLNTGGIVVLFTYADFSGSSSAIGEEIKSMVSDGFNRVKTHTGNHKLIPMLDRDRLSESDSQAIIDEFKAHGYKDYVLRN